MTNKLLTNTRRINKTLQTTAGTAVSFDQLTRVLGDVLESNVYVVRVRGKVLGYYLSNPEDSSLVLDEEKNLSMFPEKYTESLLTINETKENISEEDTLKMFPFEQDRLEKYTTDIHNCVLSCVHLCCDLWEHHVRYTSRVPSHVSKGSTLINDHSDIYVSTWLCT